MLVRSRGSIREILKLEVNLISELLVNDLEELSVVLLSALLGVLEFKVGSLELEELLIVNRDVLEDILDSSVFLKVSLNLIEESRGDTELLHNLLVDLVGKLLQLQFDLLKNVIVDFSLLLSHLDEHVVPVEVK